MELPPSRPPSDHSSSQCGDPVRRICLSAGSGFGTPKYRPAGVASPPALPLARRHAPLCAGCQQSLGGSCQGAFAPPGALHRSGGSPGLVSGRSLLPGGPLAVPGVRDASQRSSKLSEDYWRSTDALDARPAPPVFFGSPPSGLDEEDESSDGDSGRRK